MSDLAALLAATCPTWPARPDGLTRDTDLDDDPVGQVPATLRLAALGGGLGAPVAFSATLDVRVAPDDQPAARARLSEHSAAHVALGVVDLAPDGAVRYRQTHGPLQPWSAGDLDTFVADAEAEASAALAPAWRALEASGVRFAAPVLA